MTFDPVAFRSDRLPTGLFDERFSEENLAFWVPILATAARIEPGLEVLDVGCGTGGFARALAHRTPTRVTGCDRSERFIRFAERLPRVEAIRDWLGQAGFTSVVTERHLRNKRLVLADEERALLVEAGSRYAFLTGDELDEGLRAMRADAARGDLGRPEADLPSLRDQAGRPPVTAALRDVVVGRDGIEPR